jgi:hypothetical protein
MAALVGRAGEIVFFEDSGGGRELQENGWRPRVFSFSISLV